MEKAPEKINPFHVHPKTEVETIDFSDAFNQLSHKEKLYAYYMTRASWAGTKVCYFQKSYEAPALFYLIIKVFTHESVEEVKTRLTTRSSYTSDDWNNLLLYIGTFLQNCGDYYGFGANKFVPNVDIEKFKKFVVESVFAGKYPSTAELYSSIEHEIFSTSEPYALLGVASEGGLNGYYSPTLTKEEIDWLQTILIKKGINEINTRIMKYSNELFVILIASSSKSKKEDLEIHDNNKLIKIQYRDFSSMMEDIVRYLKKARDYVANENQAKTIDSYIDHFTSGDLEEHRTSQKHWIQDKAPSVETNIGFIEKYLDPLNMRAEYEGWVAITDKAKSELLSKFVATAEKFISYLPWDRAFERDKFLLPDFTALNLLTFATSIIPAGINLPNYDDITQTLGSKNIQFENTPDGVTKEALLKYLSEESSVIRSTLAKQIRFARVTLHELLGHGCGKIFLENEDGTLNYDPATVKLPNGDPVTSHYKKGELFNTLFSDLSTTIEECRAEAVSIYLVCFDDVLQALFPNESEETRDNIRYGSWIDICLGGLRGLEYYIPQAKKWGQAHMQGRYVILNVLLQAGEGLVKISSEGDGNPRVHLDRSKILTVGKEAIGKFLVELQVGKSTANLKLRDFYSNLSKVPADLESAREILMQIRSPRKLIIQNELYLNGDSAAVLNFDKTLEGLVKSHLIHYQHDIDDVEKLFSQYSKIMKYQPSSKAV